MIISRSVCPYDCPDACGLVVYSENNQVVKVAGDPEHPFTRGMLCGKMAHYERTVHSPTRIRTPLLRVGSKGSGEFRPISWQEAIAVISRKWKAIIAEHGAEAILPVSAGGTMGLVQLNAGHALFRWLGASRLDRGICAPAMEYGWKSVMGGTPGARPQEAQRSDFMLLWGINVAATNCHFLLDIQAARKQGAKVWLIDIYHQPTAQIADRTTIVKPGSDGALALGLLHVLIRDGLVDSTFITQYTSGYEELKAIVLAEYSPEAVSVLTGVAATEIEELAAAYGQAQAPFLRLGCGLSRYGNGAQSVRAITCLPAVVGAWARPGGGMLARSFAGSFDMSVLTREDLLQKPVRQLSINQLGAALALANQPIKGLYVYAANPAAVAPDQNAVLAGLSREDLFTVVHERWLTDTARYADVVLPATTSLEHADLYRAAGHFVAARAAAVIPPVGEAKSNWEVFGLLAEAMGMTDPHYRRTEEEMVDALLAQPSPWWTEQQLAAIRSGQQAELIRTRQDKVRFGTPAGKIQLLNPAEAEPVPVYKPPYGGSEEFWFVSAPDKRILNSSFNERTDLTKGEKMLLYMNPADASRKALADGQQVVAENSRGQVVFVLRVGPVAPAGVVVCEGVWPLAATANGRSVNALTWQRLTDAGQGSTFYDTKVNVLSL